MPPIPSGGIVDHHDLTALDKLIATTMPVENSLSCTYSGNYENSPTSQTDNYGSFATIQQKQETPKAAKKSAQPAFPI